MNKTLNDFLEVYKPKSPDEQKFVDKHVTIKHKDRNGNGDDVFKASNIKTVKRKEERHGYDIGDDEKVYEETDLNDLLDEALDLLASIDEKTLTPAEMKKREEVVKAIKRGNPKMDKSMAYAIATKTAKRVAEEIDDLDEMNYRDSGYQNMLKASMKADRIAAKDKARREKMEAQKKGKQEVEEEVDDLDEAAFDAASKANDRHYEKQTERVKNMLDKYAMRGMSYRDAVKKISGPGHILRNEITPLREEVEQVDEAVEVSHTRYLRSHGKKASGRGPWMFTHKLYGDAKGDDTFAAPSSAKSFSDATKHAKEWAKSKGHRTVYVMEEVEQIDEISKQTLKSYSPKAEKQIQGNQPSDVNALRKRTNREKGIKQAYLKYYGYKVKVPATEEVEQIDEVSPKLAIGAYVQRKSRADDFYSEPDDEEKAEKTLSRIDKKYGSASKIAKGARHGAEINQKGRGHQGGPGDYLDAKQGVYKGFAKPNTKKGTKQRLHYMNLNKGRFKEEVEQIDEVGDTARGRNALASYVGKAAPQILGKAFSGGAASARNNDDKAAALTNKAAKRMVGTVRASKRLAKEDIINRTIEKYVPENIKFTPEERLIKRLEGLSEAHIDIILELFDSLNIDNQNKMIETVETYEGVNQILNFALENRGR